MKKRRVNEFLLLFAVFNLPALLYAIPGIGILFFLPFSFWINVPAIWFGLAKIGAPHFVVHEFGATPQTVLGWAVIVGFWTLVAAGLTLLTALVSKFFGKNHEKSAST